MPATDASNNKAHIKEIGAYLQHRRRVPSVTNTAPSNGLQAVWERFTKRQVEPTKTTPSEAELLRSQAIAALKDLAHCNLSDCLHPVAELCLDPDEELRNLAWHIYNHSLLQIDSVPLVKLADSIRCKYLDLDPYANFEKLSKTNLPFEAYCLLSLSRDGFIRQAALEKLKKNQSGEEIPYLLLRATDWYKPIALQAQKVLKAKLNEANYQKFFTRHFYLLYRFSLSDRHDPALLSSLLKATINDDTWNSIAALLHCHDKALRDFAFSGLFTVAPNRASQEGMKTPFPKINISAAEFIAKTAPLDQRNKTLTEFLRSPHAGVRQLALRQIYDDLLKEQERDSATTGANLDLSLFQNALLDSSNQIRRFAQYVCKQEDLVSFYLNKLENATTGETVIILKALLELGKPLNEFNPSQALNWRCSKIRQAALDLLFNTKCFPNLNREQLLLETLKDSSKKCIRIATHYLESNPQALSPEQLWSFIKEAPTSLVAQISLKTLAKGNKWQVFPLILEAKKKALTEGSPQLTMTAKLALKTWMKKANLNALSPSQEQLTLCEKTLEKFKATLDSKTIEEIHFLLKY